MLTGWFTLVLLCSLPSHCYQLGKFALDYSNSKPNPELPFNLVFLHCDERSGTKIVAITHASTSRVIWQSAVPFVSTAIVKHSVGQWGGMFHVVDTERFVLILTLLM